MFADSDRAEASLKRISQLVHRDLTTPLTSMFGRWPNGVEGLARLERIFGALSGPGGFAEVLVESPELASVVAHVVCSSHHLADLMVQNPELAFSLVDPNALSRRATREEIFAEGNRLLGHALGYSHRLDRIRFLKQRHLLLLAAQDVSGLRPQPEIWRGLSDLALAVIELIRDVVWTNITGGETPCPLGIIVLGKLGGLELNYSSDIDLIFCMPDDTRDEMEPTVRRVCESMRAALSDRMGRGDLYRVDLRLRPFGSQGPLVSKISALESYYDRYAEPWEHLALIRSLALGPSETVDRWEHLRARFTFSGAHNELSIANMLKMRRRAEEGAEPGDLKRGHGGIRDVELTVQIVQLLHAESHAELRGRSTLEMLNAAEKLNIFDPQSARALREGYTLLRKVEHRCQIEGNLQTYGLPEDLALREVIAASLEYRSLGSLERDLQLNRDRIRATTEALLGSIYNEPDRQTPSWLAALPTGQTFVRAVQENRSSADRIAQIERRAPVLIPHLKQSVSVVEQVLSGEIAEPVPAGERFRLVASHYDHAEMHAAVHNGWLRGTLYWLFNENADLGEILTENTDEALKVFASRWEGCSVIGLGSYAAREMSPGSDADILVVCADPELRSVAERAVQASAVELGRLKSLGAPIEIDFRLRPEGRAGRLVSTPESLRRYAVERMEPWERFALGRARTICGSEEVGQVLDEIVYSEPLDREQLESLLAMKSRIERERVKPQQYHRHVKLGHGGLDDINWLLQLWMLREPRNCPDRPVSTRDRLACLRQAGVLNMLEHDALRESHEFLLRLRNALYLLGVGNDLIPENPDRLEILAAEFDARDANGMLRMYQSHTDRVRGIFEQSMEGLLQ